MPRRQEKLIQGQGSPFMKARLKRLRQANVTWEADFRALPQPMTQTETRSLGLVVAGRGGAVLAEAQVEGRPSVSDLATLLAQAMRRPLTGEAHRPRRLHVRGRRQWQGLLPHLEELGIQVSVTQELPKAKAAYQGRLRQMREARRARMVRPTEAQAQVAELFPALAQWVRGGHIEIGDQEGFGFVAMALDYGGVAYEDDRPRTLAEAMASLEQGVRQWYEEQGIDLE